MHKKINSKFLVKKSQASTKKNLLEKNKSLFLDLLKIHAYYGDTHLRNHYSQDSFVYAYRNDYSMYNLHGAILNLKRALHFMQKQKQDSFVFVGSPSLAKEKSSILFQRLKIPFFPSTEWVPGFISKKTYNTSKILIIYDIFTNHGAKCEAFKAGYPIVGFFTIHGDVSGIDFPINLNLENCGLWYYSLWKSYFQIKNHDTRS
jgi:ribosomal protein S2